MIREYMPVTIFLFNYVYVLNGVPNIYKGRFTGDINTYEVVIPLQVTEEGNVLHTIPYRYKRSNYESGSSKKSVDDRIFYKIPINNENYHIELHPNIKMLTPAAVVERRKKREAIDDTPLSQVKINTMEDEQCHYTGHVRGHPTSRVALSNCNGLAGFVQLNGQNYILEPAQAWSSSSRSTQPHFLYSYSPTVLEPKVTCEVSEKNLAKAYAQRAAKMDNDSKLSHRRFSRERKFNASNNNSALRQMYLETLVVLDKTLIDYHKRLDLDNYVLTVLNMAHTLFRDGTFAAPLDLVVVRMIHLDAEDDEMNLKMSGDGPKVLEIFKAWSKGMNPGDDSHPHHHDVALLITRIDICADDMKRCGLLGLANLASACDPDEQAAIVEDCGLKLGYTIAHELAHTLGLSHDSPDESGCESKPYEDGYAVVMAKSASIKTRGWSNCSREYFWLFVDICVTGNHYRSNVKKSNSLNRMGYGTCLYDEPSSQQANFVDTLPGAMYGAGYQCKGLIDEFAEECPDMAIECSNMKCLVKPHGCVQTNMPLAPGTPCDEHKWCYQDACVGEGQRPGAVDGGWSAWGESTSCSRTCGSGVSKTLRFCDNPRPSHGGLYCMGERVQYQVCNSEPCDMDKPSFREVQCNEYNDWVYPQDEQKHQWSKYDMTAENPCELFCINENRIISSLRAQVTDGTPCHLGLRHICVGGACKEIYCDMQFDSKAVEDVCGICHGDGTICNVIADEKRFEKKTKSASLLVKIPLGTRNIRVEETTPTTSLLQVRNNAKAIYVKGNVMGTFYINGTVIWVGIIHHEQETIRIPGPTTEEIAIWVKAKTDVTVKYSMATPTTKRVSSYSWQHISWSECSARCGRGHQRCVPSCVEKVNGLVEDHYCSETKKIDTLSRACELRPCLPRWQVGSWSGCDCECGTNTKNERSVHCVRPDGGDQGGIHIIEDKLCEGSKPAVLEPCDCGTSRSRRKYSQETYREPFRTNYIESEIAVRSKASKVAKDVDRKKKNKKLNIQKGKLITDTEDVQDFSLTLLLDKENRKKIFKNFPKGSQNDTSITVKGLEALKALQDMQNYNKKKVTST